MGKKPDGYSPSTNPQGEIMHLFGKKKIAYTYEVGDFQFIKVDCFLRLPG